MKLSAVELVAIMPALRDPKLSVFVEQLNAAMDRWHIKDDLACCMFLANLAHESEQFKYMQELWGPTAEQKTYERDPTQPWGPQLKRGDRNYKAWTLGNDAPGDGRKYAGHGPIQVTGKNNHRKMTTLLGGPDFVKEPLKLCEPHWGTQAAAAFWYDRGINNLVPRGFEPVVRAINGGTNGMKDRLMYLDRAKQVYGL